MQLQRTVTRRRGDGASAPFHYALASRITRQRAAVLVTVLVNVPINEEIAVWNPAALPPGYEDVLRQWWNWHIVRLITSVGAMCSVFAALIAMGGESVVPAA